MKKKIFTFLLALTASVGMSWATTTDLASITDNYTAQDGDILTGTLGVNVKISIADGATVTLLNANINGDKTWTTGEYAGLTCLGDATITIVGKNFVSGFYADELGNGYPGIYVPSGKTLIINGTGSLTAQSSTEEAAGIGARKDMSCGNIEIQSGKITAIASGEYGAGIGGAYNASCGNITISGGIVTAVGGDHCAGIGGGRRGANTNAGHCGNILICGGVVSATSGKHAAAIGGGRGNNNNYKTNCGTITITNTALKVYAEQGGDKGSTNTIGAGKYGNNVTVTIGGNTGVKNDDPYTYRTKEDGAIVVDYINAIGTVVYTQECKDKIDIARELYDALEDSQIDLVINYQTLIDAEAAYAALIPQPQIGPKEVLDLGTTGCVGEHYQLTGGGTNIYRTVGGVDNKMITIESLHGEIIDNISLKLYYYNVWTGYSVAASSGDVSSWNYDAYEDLVITNINATSVTLSRVGSGQANGYVMFEKVTINNSDEPQPQPEPEGDGKLTGAFTINADGDQILFSKGNLQYQASTTTWRFATNQYDMIGADNANISDTYTGWIDLFGWGTGNNPTNTSDQDEDYSTFVDWGVNAISNGGNEANLWRTLTIQEWGYLIQTRTNAADLKGQATVADVHGYVLLPDSWTLPAGLSFTASPNNWTTNVYTAEQWTQMEAAGAVFLPATGYRNPDIVYVDEKGWYWSSNVYTDIVAYDFEFTETNSRVFGSRHYFGQPVRLVTAAPTPTPTPQPAEDVNITPNVDPDHADVYYSTFYDSANKYALPAGVEAYVATLDGANLLLSKIAEAGQTIPADNAVILKSSVTPFTLSISDAEAVPVNAINSLQGTDESIATPANCYVLAGNDGVGFYHYTASMLNPHKAYVIYSGSQAPGRMRFIFDQATGVESVQRSAISSQKVIENGQLFIIKNGVKYNAQGQVVK